MEPTPPLEEFQQSKMPTLEEFQQQEITPTLEEIQQHINAAFDSVNLINNEITKEITEDSKNNIKRNYQHLEIMISKDWFITGCTEQQVIDINASIAVGKAYGV